MSRLYTGGIPAEAGGFHANADIETGQSDGGLLLN